MIIRYLSGCLIVVFSMLMVGCEKDFVTEGMKPLYYSYDDFSGIKSLPPEPFDNLGKIVTSNDYIFINERLKGIHVINNSDPQNPVKAYFWQIPGNQEFTILGNTLYADNGRHLLIIDISLFNNISLISVIKDQYSLEDLEDAEAYPIGFKGYFECYDATKGILRGWEKAELINPYCETN